MILTTLIVCGFGFLSGFAGWSLCGVTHRQRGIEVDEVHVPDFVPPSWGVKV